MRCDILRFVYLILCNKKVAVKFIVYITQFINIPSLT